eukprot:m.32081 g.32081  ORF g.32081 m.32081 type:complete len:83 (+) comp10747_c1_seq1:197-445(+)
MLPCILLHMHYLTTWLTQFLTLMHIMHIYTHPCRQLPLPTRMRYTCPLTPNEGCPRLTVQISGDLDLTSTAAAFCRWLCSFT